MGTEFTTWASRIEAGSFAQRTLPARISDMTNVLEWGADPTGATNSATNLQAAINAAAAKGLTGKTGSTVFFPPGVYRCLSTLSNNVANSCVQFMGSGRDTCSITDGATFTYPQALLDTTGAAGKIDSIQELRFDSFGVGVRLTGSVGTQLIHVLAGGNLAYDLSGSNGVTCYECELSSDSGIPRVNRGWFTGDNTTLINCDQAGVGECIRVCGTGFVMKGCRTESNVVSIVLGKDKNNATVPCTNFFIGSHTTERNDTAIIIYDAHDGVIGGFETQGTHGVIQQGIVSISWSGGVVTVISDNTTALSPGVGISVGGVRVGGNTSNGYNGSFFVTATPAANTFQYALASNPGTGDPTGPNCVWTWQQHRCFYIAPGGRISNVRIHGWVANSLVYGALLDLTNMNPLDSLYIDCWTPELTVTANWGAPALGTHFIPPTTPGPGLTFGGGGYTNIGSYPFAFAQLPASPVEGMMYNISDANIGGKVLGDPITAGGSTGRIKVRRNASAWTWMGK